MRDGAPLCRILEPADPWLSECSADERAANFHGKYDGEISVADTGICPAVRVLAAFHGSRSGPAIGARYFSLRASEVTAAGGQLVDTPSEPPWPPEYSDAHRDIVGDTHRVAQEMVLAFEADNTRVTEVDRNVLLGEICELLGRSAVDEKFRKNATKKLSKLQRLEPEVWQPLAELFPHIKP
jgi:hypothetical protein